LLLIFARDRVTIAGLVTFTRWLCALQAAAESIPMASTAVNVPEEDFFVLSSLPPNREQKRLALAVVVAMLIAFFIVSGWLSTIIETRRVDAFVPAYAMAMFVNESITAILLFAQFSIVRSHATLVIASGYLFTALLMIPWLLTFPDVFVPGALIGGLQSTSWFYFLWHAGFPLFVGGYAFLKDADPSTRFWHGTVSAGVALSVVLTTAVVSAASLFFVAGEALLPRVMTDPVHVSSLWSYFGWSVALVSVLALVVLWFRQRSMLDLWLLVVMFAYVLETPLTYFPAPERFNFNWYAIRVLGFLSSSFVLVVLLYEITTLYGRLLSAVRAQRREREARLVTGDAVAATIAHEVNQPLSGMITSADAGFRFLDRSRPDLEEAKEAFKQIVTDGHRAGAVIGSIRALFKKEARTRASLDLNALIGATLVLLREDLAKNRILVEAKLDKHFPQVTGDRIQLQQVLLNLITNAIESMAAIDGSRVLSVKSEVHDDGDVRVSVADTGMGIRSQDFERIFNPLFTTKSEGMGMGLSICRSIIEAHEGRLWVAPNEPRGSVFHFTSMRSAPA